MTTQTKCIAGDDEIGPIGIAVNLVAIEASHAAVVHGALDKIIALHAIFVRRCILPEIEVLRAQARYFQIPDIGKPLSGR